MKPRVLCSLMFGCGLSVVGLSGSVEANRAERSHAFEDVKSSLDAPSGSAGANRAKRSHAFEDVKSSLDAPSGSAGATPVEQNHAVEDVKASFDALTERGEWLGFRRSRADVPANHDPIGSNTGGYHFQGFARSPRTGIAPILYATRSGCPDCLLSAPPWPPELPPDANPWLSEGTLLVVEMNSRTRDGERLRSNRLLRQAETQVTLPPEEDKVVGVIAFDSGEIDYDHAGGIQMVGDILAVALSGPNTPVPPPGKVVFFDASNPRSPKRLGYEKKFSYGVGMVGVTKLPDGHFLMVVAKGGAEELVFLRSNETSFLDEGFEFHAHTVLTKEQLSGLKDTPPGYWDFGKNSPQALNFVNQRDGQLFLVGSSNTCETAPQLCGRGRRDRMWLWQVTGFDAEDACEENAAGDGCEDDNGGAWLTGMSKANKLLFSEGNETAGITFDKQEANFNASGSAYVSPTGQLLYYGTSYWFWTCKDPDGRKCTGGRGHTKCDPSDTNWWTDCKDPSYNYLRFAELHHNAVSDTATCGLQLPGDLGGPYEVDEGDTLLLDIGIHYVEPWIRMYEKANFKERCREATPYLSHFCSSHMMDHADQLADDYDKFESLDGPFGSGGRSGFDNQLNSFRWCGPPDSTLYLYDLFYYDETGNRGHVNCFGTGDVVVERDLDDAVRDETYPPDVVPAETCTYSHGVSSFDDQASSAKRGGTRPAEHAVDVDWGEAAPERWTAPWTAPVITASHRYLDDDPSGTASDVYPITVTDAEGGAAQADTSVTVHNVAPTVSIDRITDETGAEIGVDVPFALVGLTVDVFGSFTDPGVLDTHIAAVDWGDGTSDDLGDVAETVSASHAYVAPWDYTITLAVEDDDLGFGTATRAIAVVDTGRALAWIVDQLKSLAADRNVRRAIARLEGEAGGRAANGAIELLAKGNLTAGMAKIRQAMRYLEAADPRLDLGTIAGLLALSAKAVAVDTVVQAEATATRGNALRKIQQAWDYVGQGDALLAALDPVGAVRRYEKAVTKIGGGRRR
jgi:hypothetical protein